MAEKGSKKILEHFKNWGNLKLKTVAKYFINEVAWYFEMEMLLCLREIVVVKMEIFVFDF